MDAKVAIEDMFFELLYGDAALIRLLLKNQGYVDLESNKKITHLPDNLIINGFLCLRNTPIQALPKGLKVKGSVYLDNTNVESLPDDLEAKSIVVINTPISKNEELLIQYKTKWTIIH